MPKNHSYCYSWYTCISVWSFPEVVNLAHYLLVVHIFCEEDFLENNIAYSKIIWTGFYYMWFSFPSDIIKLIWIDCGKSKIGTIIIFLSALVLHVFWRQDFNKYNRYFISRDQIFLTRSIMWINPWYIQGKANSCK